MERQHYPPPAPPRSNVLVYGVVALFALGALAFFYLLFGELFILAAVVFVLIGAVGALHYFLWGRSLTESANKEAKANLEGE